MHRLELSVVILMAIILGSCGSDPGITFETAFRAGPGETLLVVFQPTNPILEYQPVNLEDKEFIGEKVTIFGAGGFQNTNMPECPAHRGSLCRYFIKSVKPGKYANTLRSSSREAKCLADDSNVFNLQMGEINFISSEYIGGVIDLEELEASLDDELKTHLEKIFEFQAKQLTKKRKNLPNVSHVLPPFSAQDKQYHVGSHYNWKKT
jgi:hypothetical protein